MQSIDIQQLSMNLQMIFAIDDNVFIETVYPVLNSEEGKTYFNKMEERVLNSRIDIGIDKKDDQDICALFLLNYLFKNEKNNILECKMFQDLELLEDKNSDFLKRLQLTTNTSNFEYIIKTRKIENINLITEQLEYVAKEDFKSFLNIIKQVFFYERYDFKDMFFYKLSKNGKNRFRFLTLFLATPIGLKNDAIGTWKTNKELVSFYEKIERNIHMPHINIKEIVTSKIELLKERKRTKQLDQFLGESFERFDAVYKALS